MRKFTFLLALMLFIGWQAANAQKLVVSGQVTSSEDGKGIPGATVLVKGTTVGVITDMDGKFTLTVPPQGKVLVISFVGMKALEVPIEGKNVINVTLEPESQTLEGVVVTALGISREKKALGYSVQDVKGEDLTKARETNVINSLSGKIAGVQVTSSSGAVGASSRIILRGVSSLGGNNEPLFVVDGVPISNSNFGGTDNEGVNRGNAAADINPDDIESISVLKGPNAAALYGSRAANGVILITTKSGTVSSVKVKGWGVELSNTTTFEKPLRLPDFQNGYGQGSGGQFFFVDGYGNGVNDGTDESWGPKLDAGLLIPQFDSPIIEGVRQATPWVSHPDNVKDFFNTGVTTATNVAITGGDVYSSFRLSFTNMAQAGMVPNTDLAKNTISLGGVTNPGKNLTISGSANYIAAKSNNFPGYGYDAQNIMQSIGNWFGRQVDIEKLKQYTNPDGSKFNWNYNYHNNPYFTLYENLNGMQRDRLYGNAKVLYKFTDNLSAFVRTGLDYYSNLNTNRCAWGDIDNAYGYYNEDATSRKEVNTDFLIMYKRLLTKDLDFNLNFGGNQMNQFYQQNTGAADELAVPGVYNLANSKIAVKATNRHTQKRINSLYFSGQFAFMKAIYVDFTGRNDWSSTLPDGKNSYFYPSVALSTVFTDLIKIDNKILPFGKVRISWAKVGSDTDPYQLKPTLSFGDGWNGGTKMLNQFVPNNLPNADLKPQYVNSLELGAELRFLSDKISLDFTYYKQQAKDQIISIPISGASGYLTKNINAGEIMNKGVEIALGFNPIRLKNSLRWDITFNWAKNTNEVVSLAEGIERYPLGTYWSMQVIASPGDAYGSLFGYDYLRTDDGQIIYRNGVPVQGNLKILGNYQPDWVGGIRNAISYKGITLDFLFDVRKGGELYSMTTTWGRYAGVLEETLIGREGGVVGEGVKEVLDAGGNVTGYVPNDVVVTAEEFNHAAYSNNMCWSSVFDASYVKLREVTLGYTFKKLGKTPFKDLNISIIGRNLAILLSNVPHIDPETSFSNTNVQGLEFGQLPSARSLGFHVSVKI